MGFGMMDLGKVLQRRVGTWSHWMGCLSRLRSIMYFKWLAYHRNKQTKKSTFCPPIFTFDLPFCSSSRLFTKRFPRHLLPPPALPRIEASFSTAFRVPLNPRLKIVPSYPIATGFRFAPSSTLVHRSLPTRPTLDAETVQNFRVIGSN